MQLHPLRLLPLFTKYAFLSEKSNYQLRQTDQFVYFYTFISPWKAEQFVRISGH